MTVQEAILSYPGLSDFPADYLNVLLISRALDGAADLSTIEMKSVSLVIADALTAAVNMPDFTENKLSTSYPRKYFLDTSARLYLENGEPEKVAARKITVPKGKANNRW